MNWTTVLSLARNRFTGTHGTWPETGDAKLTRGEAARLIDGAVEITDAAGLAWDWFPVALAVLAYEREGDKFPPPGTGADQLVGHPQSTYFWWALDFLAAQLDERGVPVRPFTQAPVADATVLELLERVAWEKLQAGRALGATPTWHPEGLPSHPWEGLEAPAATAILPPGTRIEVQDSAGQWWPATVEDGGVSANIDATHDSWSIDPKGHPFRIPKIPTPPPAPAPAEPPYTGPALPDVGGNLVETGIKLFFGYLIFKEIAKRI